MNVRESLAVALFSLSVISFSLGIMWFDVWQHVSRAEISFLTQPSPHVAAQKTPLRPGKSIRTRTALAYVEEGRRYSLSARQGKARAGDMLRASQNICFGVISTRDLILRMKHCLVSAGAGSPAAQAVVGGYYHRNARQPADRVQAYAWLRTAAAGRTDGWIANLARTQLDAVTAQMDDPSIAKAEELSLKYVEQYVPDQ